MTTKGRPSGRPLFFFHGGITMGKHFSHLTPTQRTRIDAFVRAGMKVGGVAKGVGVQ